ncbi:corresponds to STY3844 from Accession AL513382: Salmonella typhi CT18 [uncultured Candidatus Thioglobus sp.]|nr:corresponds to STY3844 from Accession AL513382: Salmonella typhi CT18 [uncultured Candidatus Thioglobus sp.]
MIAVFDTNILIDYLNGENRAKEEIAKYSQIAISIITYMEVMVGTQDTHKKEIKKFLGGFQLFNFDEKMVNEIVEIRKTLKIKLPDAIILATARKNKAVLVTRNSKDFAKNKDVVIPYKI